MKKFLCHVFTAILLALVPVSVQAADLCNCSTTYLDNDCRYIFLNPTDVCQVVNSYYDTVFIDAGMIENIGENTVLVDCGLPTYYAYSEGYETSDLSQVAFWAVDQYGGSPSGNVTCYVYARSHNSTQPWFEDGGSTTSSSPTPQGVYLDVTPGTKAMVVMSCSIPPDEDDDDYSSLISIRVCYDPD